MKSTGVLHAADGFVRFKSALQAIAEAHLSVNLEELLRIILKSSRDIASAEASSIALISENGEELRFYRISGGSKKVGSVRLQIGQGIAGRVAETGRPMIVNEASRSRYFFKKVDDSTGFRTRRVLCVPLRFQDKVVGVLEVINKAGSNFNREDLLILSTFANHAAIALENARLSREASRDSLTGIYNRRYFDSWLKNQWPHYDRLNKPLSILLIDVDRFKSINDRHGHAGGDYVLRTLAQLVQARVRRLDVLARYGGDEIILALPRPRAPGLWSSPSGFVKWSRITSSDIAGPLLPSRSASVFPRGSPQSRMRNV